MTSPNRDTEFQASFDRRLDAIQTALEAQGLDVSTGTAELAQRAVEEWIPQNGARLVAKAWSNPAFRRRLMEDGRAAALEMGLTMPPHHRHLVVLENTAEIHNVICCTQCSCTAFTIIGLP